MARASGQVVASLEELDSLRHPDYAALIGAVNARLIPLGVPAQILTPAGYLQVFLTDNNVYKLLRSIEAERDTAKIEAILNLGRDKGFWEVLNAATPAQFFKFLEWLKTPAGVDAVGLVYQIEKLKRKKGSHLSDEEYGRYRMLEAQRNDMIQATKDVRADSERRPRNVRETEMRQAGDVFYPISHYNAPSKHEFKMACWDAYVAEVHEMGAMPEDLSDDSLGRAVSAYSDHVRKRHLVDFLDHEDYFDRLVAYTKQSIGRFEAKHDKRAAKRFRGLLAVAGVDSATPVHEAAADRKDLGGQAAAQSAKNTFQPAIIGIDAKRDVPPEADKDKGEEPGAPRQI